MTREKEYHRGQKGVAHFFSNATTTTTKLCQLRVLYTTKISFNNEEKFKISSDEGKLRKCVAKEHGKENYE